jgi:hypothetical protein
MVFSLLTFLGKKNCCITDLFGEQCIKLTPNSDIFNFEFLVPEVVLKGQTHKCFFNNFGNCFLHKNENNDITANKKVFDELKEGSEEWVKKFVNEGLALIAANSHPVADVLCYLRPSVDSENKKKIFVWVSVKGPKDGDKRGAFQLTIEQIEKDINYLHSIEEIDPSYIHALVYLISNLHSNLNVKKLKKEIQILDTKQIGVLLVDNMLDIFPLLAHRCSYGSSFKVLKL